MIQNIISVIELIILLMFLSIPVCLSYEGYFILNDPFLGGFGIIMSVVMVYLLAVAIEIDIYHRKLLGYWPFNR